MSRKQLTILGRVIGTYNDWAAVDTFVFQFYDYIPNESINLPTTENLTVDYSAGKFLIYTDGTLVSKQDIIETLQHLPKP